MGTTALLIDKEHLQTLHNLQGYMNSRLQYAPAGERKSINRNSPLFLVAVIKFPLHILQ